MEQDGFTVHRRGKTISISAEGWGNNVRFDRLGDGYTLDDLLAVLSGQKEHTPRKQAVPQVAPPKVNLLVDIQAKLQAGKGAGYARWAKVFNLKQMAQTLNYLSEHGLLDYADLETKTTEATARYHALSDQIKAAEKRMAEIAVLRTHIVNYAKTRETYVAYRKAGYSKKFRQEHEEEILLHQAAKEAFNELNVKKLPTIKELQTEYAQLLADKKKGLRRVPAGPRRHAGAADGQEQCGSGPGDGAGRVATERKRPRPAVSWSRSKAFARTRSHRLKICVPRGLGGYPQQARGAIWIATGIACQYYPEFGIIFASIGSVATLPANPDPATPAGPRICLLGISPNPCFIQQVYNSSIPQNGLA